MTPHPWWRDPASVRRLRHDVDAVRWHASVGLIQPWTIAWADRAERLLMAIEARRRYAELRRMGR